MKIPLTEFLSRPETSAAPVAALYVALVAGAALASATAALLQVLS